MLLESLNAFTPQADESLRRELLEGTKESVQFYLNRILKEAKERDEKEWIDWVKEFQTALDDILAASASKSVSTSENFPNKPPNTTSQSPSTGTLSLNGNVWYCEGYKGSAKGSSSPSDVLEVKINEMQQRLVISKCSGYVIKVSGKCTAISVEQAENTGILLQDPIVSTVELLNTRKVQIQLQSTCPTMTIDNCEAIQVFLGRGVEKQFELHTSQCSEINLYRQMGDEEGEFSAEIPVPVQFKSYFDAEGHLKTEPVKHTGA